MIWIFKNILEKICSLYTYMLYIFIHYTYNKHYTNAYILHIFIETSYGPTDTSRKTNNVQKDAQQNIRKYVV